MNSSWRQSVKPLSFHIDGSRAETELGDTDGLCLWREQDHRLRGLRVFGTLWRRGSEDMEVRLVESRPF